MNYTHSSVSSARTMNGKSVPCERTRTMDDCVAERNFYNPVRRMTFWTQF